MTRRATHLPSRRETAQWVLTRILVVEVVLASFLVLDIATHINGVR